MRIYTVDTVTGAVLSSPTIAGSAFLFIQGLAFAAEEAAATVTIDIHPGSATNPINVRSRGVTRWPS